MLGNDLLALFVSVILHFIVGYSVSVITGD